MTSNKKADNLFTISEAKSVIRDQNATIGGTKANNELEI